MKNFNLTQMLQGCSKRNGMTVSASMHDDGHNCNVTQRTELMSEDEKWSENGALSPTCLRSALVLPSFCSRLDSLSLVSRQSDLDQVRAISVGLSARVWKHVAMIFAVLTLSIANIGMAWAWTDCYYVDENVGWTSTSFKVASGGSGSGYIHMGTDHYFKFRINSKPVGESTNKELTTDGSGVRLYTWNSGDTLAAKYTGDPGIVEVHIDQSTGDHDKDPWVWLTRPTIYVRHNWNNAGWSNLAMTDNNDGTYTYIGQYSGSNKTNVGPCSSCTSGGNTFKYFSSATLTGSPAKGDRCLFTYNSSGFRGYGGDGSNKGSLTITKLCSITYDGNGKTGGAVPTSQTDIVYNTSTIVSGNTGSLVRTGYAFIGWNTAADGTGKFYLPGSTFTPTATSHTLYAQWLQLHEPGVYESPEGYNKSLKTYSGREYEIYRYTETSSVISIFAGETSTTSKSDKHCVAQFAMNASSNAKFGGWIMHNGGISSVTSKASDNSAEFSAVSSAKGIKGWGGQGYFIYVSGYDQFDLWAQDKNLASNYYIKVYRDGVDVTENKNVSLTVRPYTLDPSSSYLIRIECLGNQDSNGDWLVGFSLRLPPSSCTAPSALATSSVTKKGATFTVTDGANTNNYEFYVSKSSTAPTAETEATYTSTSKTKAVTDLVAGTKYYAWVRSKCSASNKSDWVSGGNFTTNTVTVTHTLTNVTKTSGATTAGGSDYTAEFAAVSGYSMPTPTVTIGGNTATSGTDYTWNAGTGTITIPANKINGNIVITLNSVPSAPSSAVISGTYHYFPGDNISLTCTPSGNNGLTTYQWYKGGKADGNRIAGATSATFTKNSCTFDDAGSYYCKVTCNATSIWANTNSSENYDVKILRLYVNGSKSGAPYGNVDFVKVDGTTATASISLGSNWTYGFNIADGCGHYYGNAGTMQENNCTNWTTNVSGTDCGLTTTNAATYIFTINYSNLSSITTSVTYPVANQAAGKVIYFDNNVLKWTGSSIYYRIGHSSHSQADQLSLVPGTANLYKMTTREYNGFSAWQIGNAAGGNGSIYNTRNTPAITASIAYEGGAVTAAAVTVTPGEDHSTGGDAQNNNCEFYSKTITDGMKTQNVAISPYSNGTITVNYTNTSGSAATLTSGNADLAHSVILTSITAVANTGYDAGAITINGDAYAANYVVTGATTIAASFTPHVYSIALNKGDHGAANQSASVAYLADALTSITHVAANTGYNRLGYYDGATKVLNADGSFAASTVSGYITDGVWTKTSDAALTAKWEAQTYTISYKDKGNKTYSGSNLASLPTSHTYGSSTALVDGVKSGYTFVGWYTDEDCTVSAGSSIGATAKTANFTLYAKWTYSCPADNSGETIYKFVPVTSSSDNIADATDFTTENYLSELTGGTLVSHCSASGNVKMNSNGVQLASSTGYLELNFECALQTGDKVKWKCYSAAVRLCNSTTYDSSKDLVLAKSQDSYSELYITSSMEGKKKLYLMHSGSNSTIMTFELYRAGGYNVTYKANGSGESDVAHVTATVEDNMFTRNGYTFTGWNTDDEGEGDAYSAGDDVTEDMTLYAQWTCTTPTFGTNLSTTPHEVEQGDAAVTLTVAATANSGTVTYQWYSNTSKSTVGATTLTTGASYNAPTSSVGTLYYYCVATNSTSGCSTTAQSNYATVTISEAPCFKITDAGKNGSWSKSSGQTISDSDIDGTITGGSVTYSGSGTLTGNDTHGIIFDNDNDELTITLSGSNVLVAGSVITIVQHGNSGTSKETGFKVSGNSMSPATCNNGSTTYKEMTQTYTVVAADGIAGTKSFTIKWTGTNQVYLKSITVTGCVECTPINPTLTYSKTTIWMDDATLTATPTVNKDGSTGSVSFVSGNTDVATVDPSTGVVTAVARGTATITATVAADATHCENTATCDITIKDVNCGYTLIAGATRQASAAAVDTYSGPLYKEAVFNTDNTGKISSGKYVYITLTDGHYFQNGDKVAVTITTKSDQGTKELNVCVGTTSPGTCVGVIAAGDVVANDVNEVILSNVPNNTSSITIHRTGNSTTQNPYVQAINVYRYVCPDSKEFLPTGDNGNWNATANWIGSDGRGASLPTIDDRVVISKPVTIDIADAKAKDVLVNQYSGATGKITVSAGKALIIAEKMQKTTTGSNRIATAAADVIINSTRAAGTGALVMGSHDGSNAATVNFETKVRYDNGFVNQYLGSPFSDETPYVDYEIQLFKFVPAANGSHGWWNKLSYGNTMDPFMGYNQLSNNTSGNYLDLNGRTGHLNASTNVEFTIENGKMYYNSSWPENMFANSWTAPIHIDKFEDDDFVNVNKSIYIFNAGTPEQYAEGGSTMDGGADNEGAGTYSVIPVKSASELEDLGAVTTVIPAMQAFSVMATSSNPSLRLDFNRLVYTPALTDLKIEPTRAPRRAEAEKERPDAMRLRVRGENGWTANAYILGREDFTNGYDDGWDGEYMEGDGSAPQLYAATQEGYFVVNCVPEIEGTLMAFHPGRADNTYTLSFVYNGSETWYLNDVKEQKSTLISNETTYLFVSNAGDNAARFVISKIPYTTTEIATGVTNLDDETLDVQKVIYNDKVYIIRNGRIYGVDGHLVK